MAMFMVSEQLKVEQLRTYDISQEFELPMWKREVINMDIITSLLRSLNQHDSIWDIMDRTNKYAYILLVRTNYAREDYAKLLI